MPMYVFVGDVVAAVVAAAVATLLLDVVAAAAAVAAAVAAAAVAAAAAAAVGVATCSCCHKQHNNTNVATYESKVFTLASRFSPLMKNEKSGKQKEKPDEHERETREEVGPTQRDG